MIGGGGARRMRALGEGLLWGTGTAALLSRLLARRGRLAVLLHGISSERLPAIRETDQPRLTTADLEFLLDWLASRFQFLTPKEFLTEKKPGVLITFDDGLANNVTNALPVLQSFNCPAVFFVTTQHVVDPRQWLSFVSEQASRAWGSADSVPEQVAVDWYDGMNIDQLRACAMDDLVTIGSHGLTHAVLTKCDRDSLVEELRGSRAFLERVIGAPVEYFAYPEGHYDARVMAEVEAAGYDAAFAIDSEKLGRPRLEVPRVGLYRADSRYLSLKMSGLHRYPLPVHKDKSTLFGQRTPLL